MLNKGLILLLFLSSVLEVLGYQRLEGELHLSQESIQSVLNDENLEEDKRVVLLFGFAKDSFNAHDVDLGLKTIHKALLLADSIGYKASKTHLYATLSVFFGQDFPDLQFYYERRAEESIKDDLSLTELQTQSSQNSPRTRLTNEELKKVLIDNLSLFDSESTIEIRAAILSRLGHLELILTNFEESIAFFEEAHELFDDSDELYPSFYTLGYTLSILNTLERFSTYRAIELKLKRILFKNSDSPYFVLMSKAMASSYARQGLFIMSIEFYLRSIDAFIQSGDLALLPNVYLDLGVAYENLYLFEKAVDSFKTCIQVLDGIGAKYRIAEMYTYLIFPLIELEQYDEAQKYIELAENDTVFTKTAFHFARLADARGQILMNQERYEEAIDYFEDALTGFKSIDEIHWGIPYVMLNISACYGRAGQTEKALKYALDSKGIGYEGQQKLARRTNQLISKLYETKGDFSPALRYLKEYENIVESSNKDDELRILADAEIQSILERSNREIIALGREQQLAEQINTTQRLWLTVILGALIFTLLLSYVLYRNYRIKMNTNSRLLREKEKVEDTLQKLRTTQEQLVEQEKLASLGQLTAGIAHEIKNPLNFVTNYSELGQELLLELENAVINNDEKEIKDAIADLKKSLSKISKNGKRADSIVKGMLQHSRSGSSEKSAVDINKLSEEYLQLAYHAHRAINQSLRVDVEMDLDPELGVKVVNAQDIGRVILNVISNALFAVSERHKNRPQDYIPRVNLSTKSGLETFTIKVQDNGPGIPEDIRDKVFEPFFTTKKGTDGTGLGLSISYDIVKSHGGKLKISSDAEGTLVTITLPA